VIGLFESISNLPPRMPEMVPNRAPRASGKKRDTWELAGIDFNQSSLMKLTMARDRTSTIKIPEEILAITRKFQEEEREKFNSEMVFQEWTPHEEFLRNKWQYFSNMETDTSLCQRLEACLLRHTLPIPEKQPMNSLEAKDFFPLCRQASVILSKEVMNLYRAHSESF
jgi:hypothetical protein